MDKLGKNTNGSLFNKLIVYMFSVNVGTREPIYIFEGTLVVRVEESLWICMSCRKTVVLPVRRKKHQIKYDQDYLIHLSKYK